MPETRNLPHIATRVFNTPLLITREKLDVILQVLGPRMGMEAKPEPAAALAAEVAVAQVARRVRQALPAGR